MAINLTSDAGESEYLTKIVNKASQEDKDGTTTHSADASAEWKF